MTDTFRKEYKPLDEIQKALIHEIKCKAEEMERLICHSNVSTDPRYTALAKTQLELVVMWAVKAMT